MKRIVVATLYSGQDFDAIRSQKFSRAGLKPEYFSGKILPDGKLYPSSNNDFIDLINEISGHNREDDVEFAVDAALSAAEIDYLVNTDYRIRYIEIRSARIPERGNNFSDVFKLDVEVGIYVSSMPRHMANFQSEYMTVEIPIK